jgi:ribosomal protein S18 acetylase RimI-like enzyme
MEYRGISPQPVFAMGEPEGISAILRDVVRPRIAYLGAKQAAFRGVRQHYRLDAPAPMLRMVVERDTFQPVVGDAVRLDQGDTGHLNRLYQLGFNAYLPDQAVAAVGNVFTHREYRGQGLGKVVTSAVTADLLRECDTVVLNVRADNPPALALYRALGYREHTEFEERLIHRDTSLWDSIVGPVRAFVSDLRRNG